MAALVCWALDAKSLALLFVLLPAVLAAIALTIWQHNQRRLTHSGIAEIDLMDGITFERYLETLFSGLGYRVHRTRTAGDFGADLVATKEGTRTIVQAKRYTKRVGVRAVQEAVAARGMYQGSEAIVVTNNYYTDQAAILAKANGVVLWDRDYLVNMILYVQNMQK